MNWSWRNLIKPIRPVQFGFLDHDLIPTKPCDPFADLGDKPFYGDKRWNNGRWFLWAGYCFFRFDMVANRKLDFGLDWFVGLDTGGANWGRLYRNFDPKLLRDRTIQTLPVWRDVRLEDAYFEVREEWLHEVGVAGLTTLRAAKRSRFKELMSCSEIAAEALLGETTSVT
jgi:hypothetical protein